jgi:hypothetical protein
MFYTSRKDPSLCAITTLFIENIKSYTEYEESHPQGILISLQ